jgi:hypothetical protein
MSEVSLVGGKLNTVFIQGNAGTQTRQQADSGLGTEEGRARLI